ncbi:hypothetical protein [Roseovarius sp. Pro17]|uniref:hypothetical protein n=1 Tax=Roseovarius sp. Pro17 TaxID=3108175 RepID=UPI002D771C11|nr:hypothetical protein [Roseovarius sp. Pro17]
MRLHQSSHSLLHQDRFADGGQQTAEIDPRPSSRDFAGSGYLGIIGLVPFSDGSGQSRQRKTPVHAYIKHGKVFLEHCSIFPKGQKFKTPGGVLIIWIIADNAPPTDDLSIARNNLALRQARIVPALHPLIVADEVDWVSQFHQAKMYSIS